MKLLYLHLKGWKTSNFRAQNDAKKAAILVLRPRSQRSAVTTSYTTYDFVQEFTRKFWQNTACRNIAIFMALVCGNCLSNFFIASRWFLKNSKEVSNTIVVLHEGVKLYLDRIPRVFRLETNQTELSHRQHENSLANLKFLLFVSHLSRVQMVFLCSCKKNARVCRISFSFSCFTCSRWRSWRRRGETSDQMSRCVFLPFKCYPGNNLV